jgi:hypothetical protein
VIEELGPPTSKRELRMGDAVTLWFHPVEGTWTVLETSRYSDDVEF